jgi:hypothetical protein
MPQTRRKNACIQSYSAIHSPCSPSMAQGIYISIEEGTIIFLSMHNEPRERQDLLLSSLYRIKSKTQADK